MARAERTVDHLSRAVKPGRLANLVLPVAGALAVACAPAAKLTDAELDAYAAGLRRVPATSVPTAEPTIAPVLPARVEPSATPRPPEPSPTATLTPRERADLASKQAMERERIMQTTPPPEKLPDNAPAELKTLYNTVEGIFTRADGVVARSIKNVLYDSVAKSPKNPPVTDEATLLRLFSTVRGEVYSNPQNPQQMLAFARKMRDYATNFPGISPHRYPELWEIEGYKLD